MGKPAGSVRAHLLQAEWAVRAGRGWEHGARPLAELARGLPQVPPRVRANTAHREPGELARRELDRLLSGGALAGAPSQRLHRRRLDARAQAAELFRERPGLRRILLRRIRVGANAAGGGRCDDRSQLGQPALLVVAEGGEAPCVFWVRRGGQTLEKGFDCGWRRELGEGRWLSRQPLGLGL